MSSGFAMQGDERGKASTAEVRGVTARVSVKKVLQCSAAAQNISHCSMCVCLECLRPIGGTALELWPHSSDIGHERQGYLTYAD